MDFPQTQQASHNIVGSVVDNRRQFGPGATFNANNIAGANGDDYSWGISRTPAQPQIDTNLHSTTTGPLPIQINPSSAHVGITGSVFNVNSPPISHAASPQPVLPSAINRGRTSNKSTPFVESEIYARNLLLRRKGYPLWKPKAKTSSLPDFYKKEGVQIGDVGLLTDSGGFDYLFNICHDESHELNEGRVPRGFIPIILDNEIEEYPQEYRHGDYVPSHPSEICGREIESNPNKFDMGLSFTPTGTKGALLLLPEGGERVDHKRLRHFESYITENAQSWHAHVFSGPMGRGEYDDSLYLVTGYDKARAWGMACFDCAKEGNVHLDFVCKAASNDGPEYWFHRCDSAVSSSDADNDYRKKSGCVFLRGFRITLRNSRRLFKPTGSVEVTNISRLNADKLIPTSPKTTPTSWSVLSWFSHPSVSNIGIERQASFNNEADSDLLSKYAVYHPSDVINNMILDNNKQIDIAITHDDDWASAIQENDNEMPQDQELIHRVCGFPLQCIESGGYTSASIIIPTQQSVVPTTSTVIAENSELKIHGKQKSSKISSAPQTPRTKVAAVFPTMNLAAMSLMKDDSRASDAAGVYLNSTKAIPLSLFSPLSSSMPSSSSLELNTGTLDGSTFLPSPSTNSPLDTFVDPLSFPVFPFSDTSGENPFSTGLRDALPPVGLQLPSFPSSNVLSASPTYSERSLSSFHGDSLSPHSPFNVSASYLSVEPFNGQAIGQRRSQLDSASYPPNFSAQRYHSPSVTSSTSHSSAMSRGSSDVSDVSSINSQLNSTGSTWLTALSESSSTPFSDSDQGRDQQRDYITTEKVRLASQKRRKKPAGFFCVICRAEFTARHNLINHENTHKGARNFTCQDCGNKFTTRSVLKRHINLNKCKKIGLKQSPLEDDG